MKSLKILVPLLFILSGCVNAPKGIEPVSGFEVNRYLGKWYEIARLDHSFERGLQRVTAEYSLNEDGSIKVTNRGFAEKKGQWKEATGKARFVDKTDTGHLKVSFFGPFYAAYVIFDLDSNYQNALVAGNDRSYLWILSRHSVLDEKTKNRLLEQVKSKNFDVSKLIWVDQALIGATIYSDTKTPKVKL